MPYATSGDARIYYEVRGEGPSLVLVEGLGYARWMWIMQVDDLSRDHKLIIYDNRGVGKSDKPNYPYTMDLFADDLKAVMDAVGAESAHILGVSMGGMIAQWFALKYPDSVRSLILVSTHHGGKDIKPIPRETLNAMFGPPPSHLKSERDILAYKMRYAFSPGWPEANRELFEKLIDLRMREPQPPEAYMNQARAALTFDASDRLHEIQAPTLIIHGDQDRVVPVGNAFKLHAKIKNSRLVIFKGAGHLVIIERASEFNNIVREFIKSVEQETFRPIAEPIYI